MKSTLSLFTLALSATSVLADGGFVSTCDPTTVKVKGKYLTATCKNIVGVAKCSKLDLNSCLKNSFGQLDLDPIGLGPHFTDRNQCVNCSNEKPSGGFIVGGGSTTVMYCQCNPGSGSQSSWPTAIFDLDTLVTNNNGALECYKTKGTDC